MEEGGGGGMGGKIEGLEIIKLFKISNARW